MPHIEIDIAQQTLTFFGDGQALVYPVSTALNGVGEIEGSERTPRGLHVISEKLARTCQSMLCCVVGNLQVRFMIRCLQKPTLIGIGY